MENAAKALVIAGGILLAIMTLTMLIYGLTATTRMAEAQEQSKKVEEVTKFNTEFESYNKKRMFGVDVVTVINKAINNNAKMNIQDPDRRYYVNIIVNIPNGPNFTDFKNTVDIIKINKNSGEESYDISTSEENSLLNNEKVNVKDEHGNSVEKSLNELCSIDTVIEAGHEYELGTFVGNAGGFNSNPNFVKMFSQNAIMDNIRGEYNPSSSSEFKFRWIFYSQFTNFKRAVFTCEDVIYSPETGRIYEMKFTQVNTNS